MACLDEEGMKEIDTLITYYLENAKLLRETMESIGHAVYGGTDAPYVFVKLPGGDLWAAFPAQGSLEREEKDFASQRVRAPRVGGGSLRSSQKGLGVTK